MPKADRVHSTPPLIASPTQLSRRTMMTALAAAASSLPALLPEKAAASLPQTTENPELLALGAEVEANLSAYRATAARLSEARAIAAGLWPSMPPELVVSRNHADLDFWADCYAPEVDFEGNKVGPEPYAVDGETFGLPPRHILQADALREFLADVQADPDFGDDIASDIASRLHAAERYEAACANAIEVSGIEQASRDTRRSASHLRDLLLKIRDHRPRTMEGVLIVACAVTAFGEAQKDSYWPSRHVDIGGNILGATLADAILRVANKSAV